MKLALLFVALVACGGSSKQPAPVSNTAEPAGTGEAKVVSDTKSGGVITLDGDREQAMKKAHDEMAAACGGAESYTITQEGEEAINPDGAPVETAWRVHYVCNN